MLPRLWQRSTQPAAAALCLIWICATGWPAGQSWAQAPAQPTPAPAQSGLPQLPGADVIAENSPPAQPPQALPGGDGLFNGRSILDGTLFSATPVQGYLAPTSSTGTMISVPDIELPLTVNVITRDAMNDQQAIRLSDVFRDAGAVVPSGGDSINGDNLIIRGQQVANRDFRNNGFFDPTLGQRRPTEPGTHRNSQGSGVGSVWSRSTRRHRQSDYEAADRRPVQRRRDPVRQLWLGTLYV